MLTWPGSGHMDWLVAAIGKKRSLRGRFHHLQADDLAPDVSDAHRQSFANGAAMRGCVVEAPVDHVIRILEASLGDAEMFPRPMAFIGHGLEILDPAFYDLGFVPIDCISQATMVRIHAPN